jgi:hypothetical protein
MKKRASRKAPAAEQNSVVAGISLPPDQWKLIRAVAFRRAKEGGGRASASKVISDLIEANRKDLEREAGRFLELM